MTGTEDVEVETPPSRGVTFSCKFLGSIFLPTVASVAPPPPSDNLFDNVVEISDDADSVDDAFDNAPRSIGNSTGGVVDNVARSVGNFTRTADDCARSPGRAERRSDGRVRCSESRSSNALPSIAEEDGEVDPAPPPLARSSSRSSLLRRSFPRSMSAPTFFAPRPPPGVVRFPIHVSKETASPPPPTPSPTIPSSLLLSSLSLVRAGAARSSHDVFVSLRVSSSSVAARGARSRKPWWRRARRAAAWERWSLFPRPRDEGFYHQMRQRQLQAWYDQKREERRRDLESTRLRKREKKLQLQQLVKGVPLELEDDDEDDDAAAQWKRKPKKKKKEGFLGVFSSLFSLFPQPRTPSFPINDDDDDDIVPASAFHVAFELTFDRLTFVYVDPRDPRVFCLVSPLDSGVAGSACLVFKAPSRIMASRVAGTIQDEKDAELRRKSEGYRKKNEEEERKRAMQRENSLDRALPWSSRVIFELGDNNDDDDENDCAVAIKTVNSSEKDAASPTRVAKRRAMGADDAAERRPKETKRAMSVVERGKEVESLGAKKYPDVERGRWAAETTASASKRDAYRSSELKSKTPGEKSPSHLGPATPGRMPANQSAPASLCLTKPKTPVDSLPSLTALDLSVTKATVHKTPGTPTPTLAKTSGKLVLAAPTFNASIHSTKLKDLESALNAKGAGPVGDSSRSDGVAKSETKETSKEAEMTPALKSVVVVLETRLTKLEKQLEEEEQRRKLLERQVLFIVEEMERLKEEREREKDKYKGKEKMSEGRLRRVGVVEVATDGMKILREERSERERAREEMKRLRERMKELVVVVGADNNDKNWRIEHFDHKEECRSEDDDDDDDNPIIQIPPLDSGRESAASSATPATTPATTPTAPGATPLALHRIFDSDEDFDIFVAFLKKRRSRMKDVATETTRATPISNSKSTSTTTPQIPTTATTMMVTSATIPSLPLLPKISLESSVDKFWATQEFPSIARRRHFLESPLWTGRAEEARSPDSGHGDDDDDDDRVVHENDEFAAESMKTRSIEAASSLMIDKAAPLRTDGAVRFDDGVVYFDAAKMEARDEEEEDDDHVDDNVSSLFSNSIVDRRSLLSPSSSSFPSSDLTTAQPASATSFYPALDTTPPRSTPPRARTTSAIPAPQSSKRYSQSPAFAHTSASSMPSAQLTPSRHETPLYRSMPSQQTSADNHQPALTNQAETRAPNYSTSSDQAEAGPLNQAASSTPLVLIEAKLFSQNVAVKKHLHFL